MRYALSYFTNHITPRCIVGYNWLPLNYTGDMDVSFEGDTSTIVAGLLRSVRGKTKKYPFVARI